MYYTNGNVLVVKTVQKDLGVIVSDRLTWPEQYISAVGKARMTLYLRKHVYCNPSTDLHSKLYCTYIRPHIEYAISIWKSSQVEDKLMLSRVSHEAT